MAPQFSQNIACASNTLQPFGQTGMGGVKLFGAVGETGVCGAVTGAEGCGAGASPEGCGAVEAPRPSGADGAGGITG